MNKQQVADFLEFFTGVFGGWSQLSDRNIGVLLSGACKDKKEFLSAAEYAAECVEDRWDGQYGASFAEVRNRIGSGYQKPRKGFKSKQLAEVMARPYPPLERNARCTYVMDAVAAVRGRGRSASILQLAALRGQENNAGLPA